MSYYQGNQADVQRHHEDLLRLPYAHPSYRLWTYCMIGDIDSGLDEYTKAVNDDSRTFIDFGNVRAMSRAKLPMTIVEKIEAHPRFKELMHNERIDDVWRDELVQRLNEVSDVTGVVVQPD